MSFMHIRASGARFGRTASPSDTSPNFSPRYARGKGSHPMPRSPLSRALTTVLIAVLLSFGALLGGAWTNAAGAQTNKPIDGVANRDATTNTPIKAEVWALESIPDANIILAGGKFTEVVDRSAGRRIAHPYLAAFNASTGEFVPTVRTTPNGPVYDIKSLGGTRVLIAGEFTAVNQLPNTGGLAVIDLATGAVDTRFRAAVAGNDAGVRSVDISGGWIYAVGSFTSARGGSVATLQPRTRAAKFRLSDGQLDGSWTPSLNGGGGWGVSRSSSGVHIGGYFLDVNGVADTEALATVDATNGALVSGWNHGLPWPVSANWSTAAGGAINDLEAVGSRLFAVGAKHRLVELQTGNGDLIRLRDIRNDGQSIDVAGGRLLVGCHCSVELRWTREYSASSGEEITSSHASSLRGGAGTWASELAPDGCVWHGGNFTSSVGAGTTSVWSLARTCSAIGGGGGTFTPDLSDRTPPRRPGVPTISGQVGSSITLTWPKAADDSGQVRYQVIRNGQRVGVAGTNVFTDQFVGAGSYDWQVQAVDMTGNVGPVSERSARISLPGQTNYALRRSATGAGGASFPAATDGSAGALVETDYVQIDLGANRSVDKINVLNNHNRFTKLIWSTDPIVGDTAVEASFAKRNVGLGDDSGANVTVEVGENVRYIRLHGISANQPAEFGELQVIGTPAHSGASARAVDTQSPAQPSWAATSPMPDGTIHYRWGRESDNVGVTSYLVHRDGVLIATTTNPWFVGAASELPLSKNDIVARDADGNVSHVLTPPETKPGEPQSCFATGIASDEVRVTWTEGTPATAERHVIRRSRNNGSFYWAGSNTGASWVNRGLNPGNYSYQVAARNNVGTSGWVDCGPTGGVAITAASTLPVRPVSCWAAKVSPTEIQVTWSAALNDNATKYIVKRARDGATTFFWAGAPAASPWSNPGVSSGTYAYTVQARNGSGISEPRVCGPNGGVVLDAADANPDPVRPTACTATKISATEVRIDWTRAQNDNATRFVVRRSRNGGTAFWATAAAAPARTWTNTGIASPGTYRYTVEARNDNGTSAAAACTPGTGIKLP